MGFSGCFTEFGYAQGVRAHVFTRGVAFKIVCQYSCSASCTLCSCPCRRGRVLSPPSPASRPRRSEAPGGEVSARRSCWQVARSSRSGRAKVGTPRTRQRQDLSHRRRERAVVNRYCRRSTNLPSLFHTKHRSPRVEAEGVAMAEAEDHEHPEIYIRASAGVSSFPARAEKLGSSRHLNSALLRLL